MKEFWIASVNHIYSLCIEYPFPLHSLMSRRERILYFIHLTKTIRRFIDPITRCKIFPEDSGLESQPVLRERRHSKILWIERSPGETQPTRMLEWNL